MHLSGPPQPAAVPRDPLRVVAAHRQVFDYPSVTAKDPRLAEFLTDMLAPYGMSFRPDLLELGDGQSFGEMGEPMLAELATGDAPVDLLVLAFAMHDLRPGQATTTYLSHVCPGNPMAFSVCDQGVAAGFSALRLIQTYARTGDFRRCLLLVMEQTALCYDPAAPAPRPDRHAAVGLLLEPDGLAAAGAVRQHSRVTHDRAGDLLRAELADLAGSRDAITVVLGSAFADELEQSGQLAGLAELPGSARAVDLLIAPSGQPATGPWWQLAGGLPAWSQAGRLVLVADYEPALRYLSVVPIDFSALGTGDSAPAVGPSAAETSLSAL